MFIYQEHIPKGLIIGAGGDALLSAVLGRFFTKFSFAHLFIAISLSQLLHAKLFFHENPAFSIFNNSGF